ncbi:MAG: hypothetical protein IT440_05545 [Phycisphaeraceae bacterium]|nr:hypothetical protein [Phycisphaeraceae bacterium]
MAEMRNPFEHHHEHHDHDHDHDQAEVETLIDPAQQALADALRVSFTVLKVVMLVLVVLYLVSNVFSVKTQENAVRLRFGKIVGEVLPAGGPYFALPYPIEQVIRIPTSIRTVTINDGFWFQTQRTPTGQTLDVMQGQPGPLNPEKDGSLLTADANIVHTQWSVTYRIDDPKAFIASLGTPQDADLLVQRTSEQAIVHAVARLTSDELLKGITNEQTAKGIAAASLAQLKAGIRIETMSMTHHTVPLATRDAFQAVLNAESEKGQLIEAAQQERARILGETAGESHDALLKVIERYEKTSEDGTMDAAKLVAIDAQINATFTDLKIDDRIVGGKVAEVANSAKSYRTSVVEQVRAEADRFGKLLDEYRKNPRIVESRLWQGTREEILGSKQVETFYVSPGQLYLEMNRDPSIQRTREEDRIKSDAENRAAGIR